MKTIKLPNLLEDRELKRIALHDPRHKVRLRAEIVIFAQKCKILGHIAKELHCSLNTVKKVLLLWNMNGIGSIITWRRTTSYKKSFKRRKMLEKLIKTTPRSLNLPFKNWSLQTIRSFLYKYLGLKLARSTIHSDLKRLNIFYRRFKEKLVFKPPHYDIFRAQMQFLRRFLPPDWRIIYLDEKGPLGVKRYLGKLWTTKHHINDKRFKQNGSVLFLGAFDPEDLQLELFSILKISNVELFKVLPLIVNRFKIKDVKHLIFVMDNHIVHHTQKFRNFFKRRRNMDLIYLPAYSPELNPIELCFKHLQEEVFNNGLFTTGVQIHREVYRYVQYFNHEKKRFLTLKSVY